MSIAAAWSHTLSAMKRMALPPFLRNAAAVVCIMCFWATSPALAQGEASPPQGTSRGENFSAKPPAALFASDCTGADCHKSPQGLAKGQRLGGLAGFLREHYTNSRESAAALAGYLAGLPSGPEPRETRSPRSGASGASATAPTEAPSRQNPNLRTQRGRQPTAAVAPPPAPPELPPEPQPVPEPQLLSEPQPPKLSPAGSPPPQFDIFD